MPTNLPKSTICYFVRGPRNNQEIYLGEKVASPKAIKRKIAGKLMSYGGDIDPTDRSVKAGLVRELEEESGFKVEEKDLEVMAEVLIIDENGPRLILYYLFARSWTGIPGHFEDILNPRWFSTRPLPSNINEADKIILPSLLDGKKLKGSVTYNENMDVIAHNLIEVESIE